MATYYRWRKSELVVKEETSDQGTKTYTGISQNYIYGTPAGPDVPIVNGYYDFSDATKINLPSEGDYIHRFNYNFAFEKQADFYVYQGSGSADVWNDGDGQIRFTVATESRLIKSAGTFIGYVYSISSSAYPNGGVQDGYYYDQRTTVTSPTAPTGLTYPNPITTPTVTVSWQAATSNTDYPVTGYNLYYGKNGDESTTNIVYPQNNPNTSAEVQIPSDATSIRFWVGARDSNGNVTVSEFGPWVSVYLAPTLTIPQMVMQGQQATVSWSAVEGADSYTLQRKSSADADWTQVYSGADLSYTETVGTWTSLQYRVQAVFDGTPGGWATSDPIQIVSASSLVISGQDGDLGTLTSDVPYSISSDQTSPTIDVTVEVNGGEYASFQATSGQTYKVSVLDLPTGTGSIVITASAEVSDSPVTVTRTWTYSKTAQMFPNSGSVTTLTQDNKVVYPETLTEAVRTSMTPWGGNLSTALNLLKNATLFNRTQQPKYSEVTIDLSSLTQTDAQNGKIINLPVNGVMTPHRVVHIGNPNPELYDSSCDGVWVQRIGNIKSGKWNNSNKNTLVNSTIMQTMSSYLADYDSAVQSAIKTVKIPYCAGDGSSSVNSGANGLECKVFPLSAKEVGLDEILSSTEILPTDGAKLDYYLSGNGDEARAKRAFSDPYFLRTPRVGADVTSYVAYIEPTPAPTISFSSYIGATAEYKNIPSFILPTTFSAGPYYVATDGTIHDAQEYEEDGTWSDVWGNAIPAIKLETGSYTGTGTYGQSNPNTLTLPFKPKVVFVTRKDSFLGTGGAFVGFVWLFGQDTITSHGPTTFTVNENGLSWYSNGASNQLNVSGVNYVYAALG